MKFHYDNVNSLDDETIIGIFLLETVHSKETSSTSNFDEQATLYTILKLNAFY